MFRIRMLAATSLGLLTLMASVRAPVMTEADHEIAAQVIARLTSLIEANPKPSSEPGAIPGNTPDAGDPQ